MMNDIYGVDFCRPYGTSPVFMPSIPSDKSLGYFRMSLWGNSRDEFLDTVHGQGNLLVLALEKSSSKGGAFSKSSDVLSESLVP
jgi:hypothetical protein